MSYRNRIRTLEKRYSNTNVAKDESLLPSTISQINRNYNKNQQKRRVDGLLNSVKNKDSIKEEVHDIVRNVKLKSLCYNCPEEQIIAIIILYVQRTRNTRFRVDKTALWNEYEVTWTKYSLIIERLLKWTREQQTMIKTDKVVDNEDFIWWGYR